MTDTLKIAAISGSLRDSSYNTSSLKAAAELAPEGVELDIITLHDLPLYNADVEAEGFPEAIQKLQKRIRAADGVLFATPEYNYSMTGVLKNAIDWLSRPHGDAPLAGKPAAMIGATPSIVGTARAQAHLRDVMYYNAMPLLSSAEVLIFKANEKFDAGGRLTDPDSRKFLGKLMQEFTDWIRQLKAGE